MKFFVYNKLLENLYEYNTLKEALEEIDDSFSKYKADLNDIILIEGNEILLKYGKVRVADE